MKTMRGGLSALAARIEEIDAKKEDFKPHAKKIKMEDDGKLLTIDGIGTYGIEELAHGQIAGRLGIDKRYYDKMDQIPGLRATNVNAWLDKKKDEKFFVRTLDNNTRAFLSDTFKPIDNLIIANAFLPIVQDMKLKVKSANLTTRKMYIQVVFSEIAEEIAKGDLVQFGLTLTNSEVGCASVNLGSFFFRRVCSNGMNGESLIKKYHVGRRVGNNEEDYTIFDEETIMLEIMSFQKRFQNILEHALKEGYAQSEFAKMRRAAGQEVKDVAYTVENVTKRFGYSEEKKLKMMMNIGSDIGKPSRWSIANSITALAHEIEDQDLAYEIEKDGYEIIDMPEKEWKNLVS